MADVTKQLVNGNIYWITYINSQGKTANFRAYITFQGVIEVQKGDNSAQPQPPSGGNTQSDNTQSTTTQQPDNTQPDNTQPDNTQPDNTQPDYTQPGNTQNDQQPDTEPTYNLRYYAQPEQQQRRAPVDSAVE